MSARSRRIRHRLPLLLAVPWLLLSGSPLAAQRIPYRVLPESVFEVRTGTSGMLGNFAHEHLVRADSFLARLAVDTAALEHSRLEMEIPAGRLRVATDADADDREEIRRAMLEEVLDADRHPVLRFRTVRVTPTEEGVTLLAELTLVGVTRGVVVPLEIERRGDTIRAHGTFTAKQSHYDIEPYSVKWGTVRVADEMTFRVDAVAVPEETGGS